MYALPWPEAQLSMCLFTVKDEDGITEIGNVRASRKVLPRVYIARAAVNESVCEDSQTDNVWFASAAVSTSVYTIAEVILEI